MKKVFIMIMAVSALFLSSCREAVELEQDNSSITLSQDSYVAGPEGGSIEVVITSSEDWRVSGNSDWVTLSAESGKNGDKITFTVAENTDGVMKESVYKLFSGSAVKEFKLTSQPNLFMTLASEPEVDFDAAGGVLRVSLDSNMPDYTFEFTESGADWIVFSDKKQVFGKKMLTFNVNPSDIYLDRTSSITIKGENDMSVNVVVNQERLFAVVTDQARLEYNLEARDVTFTVKTNVEYDALTLPEWMTIQSEKKGEMGADGLTPVEYTIHMDESLATRMANLDFICEGKTYLSMLLKQQNPNPIWAEISDAGLRTELMKQGWIIAEEGMTKCEVLMPGLESETLYIEAGWYDDPINMIDGLSAFPNLKTVHLYNVAVKTLDLSGCKSLTKLQLDNTDRLSVVNCADTPLTEFVLTSGDYSGYLISESLSVSGPNIEKINVNCSSWYMSYYETCATMDFTGCPKLTEIKAKREYQDYWSDTGIGCKLKTIYVTADQKAAIDAGTITVEKSDMTNIEVK